MAPLRPSPPSPLSSPSSFLSSRRRHDAAVEKRAVGQMCNYLEYCNLDRLQRNLHAAIKHTVHGTFISNGQRSETACPTWRGTQSDIFSCVFRNPQLPVDLLNIGTINTADSAIESSTVGAVGGSIALTRVDFHPAHARRRRRCCRPPPPVTHLPPPHPPTARPPGPLHHGGQGTHCGPRVGAEEAPHV